MMRWDNMDRESLIELIEEVKQFKTEFDYV